MCLLTLLLLHFFICKISTLNPVQGTVDDEERNERCCSKHLSCCKKKAEPTNFEVRALLVKCPQPSLCIQMNKHQATHCEEARQKKLKRIQNDAFCTNEKEYEQPKDVVDCAKKLMLTIKMRNTGLTNVKSQYIIIDHVFDTVSEKKQKLNNPYVLKIKQGPILQTYLLMFESVVNSEAKERVVNKKDESYTGCSADPLDNPTCGTVKYNSETIPYSTGFCCSCKDDTVEKVASVGEPEELEGLEIPKRQINSDEFRRQNVRARSYRLIQKRGGQDCQDKFTPPNADPNTYHDSAHCLEFADFWYTVYKVGKPKIYHSLQIEIFEKLQNPDGSYRWRDLTKHVPINVGTETPHFINERRTIAVNYETREWRNHLFALNYKIHKLLIPDSSKNVDANMYPEIQGGPPEYLVLNENMVDPTGKSCNVAGVGYEAFAKQPNRCSMPKDSCLKNQPSEMWKHDHEAASCGKKGKYFLKFFGLLPENPILSNESSQDKSLAMYFTQTYTSQVDIQVKADFSTILRPNALAAITEAYVDSSSVKKTLITAKVFNSGLISGIFFVSLTDCPMDMPASFSNIASKPALIAPQYQHIFNLEVECPLPSSSFYCSLEVLNLKEELIAVRKIRLQRSDRCICVWYCLCTCLLADKGLKCKPLSLEHYHAAGFQGGMPVASHVVQYSVFDDFVSLMLYILLFVCLALLIMGLTKAIVGCCSVPVGLWGLDIVLDLPKPMNHYYEADLKDRTVIYDNSGWPVNPDTNERVRNISLPAEFCINIIFFFVYPFVLMWVMMKKMCFASEDGSCLKDYQDYDSCNCRNGTQVQRRSSSLQNSLIKSRSSNNVEKERKSA